MIDIITLIISITSLVVAFLTHVKSSKCMNCLEIKTKDSNSSSTSSSTSTADGTASFV